MHDLELQAAVDEVEPGGAVHVHGGAKLSLREGLVLTQVRGGHAPVGQGDLDVQGHGGDVRHQHKGDAASPSGQGAPEEAVAEQEPVAAHEDNLGGSNPPRLATGEGR